MSDKLLKFVNMINNGEIDILEDHFDDMSVLFELLDKKGYLHLIDPFDTDLGSHHNKVVYAILNSSGEGSDKLFKRLANSLGDIDEINGEYYLNISELTDLAELFKSYSRDVSPRDVAEKVLGEDYWEAFWDTTDNVYRDVIDELNPQNLEYLKEYILKQLGGKEIELDGSVSDLMEELAQEQTKETSFTVTPQNIDRIVKDEDTMDWLFYDELSDLKSELTNIHSNAYNNAYENEYYRKVWNELGEYVENKPEWFEWGKQHRVRLKLKKNVLLGVIVSFFGEYKDYNDSFDYYGSFISLLEHLMDTSDDYEYLDFRIGDYPDHREVDKNINEYFKDYL